MTRFTRSGAYVTSNIRHVVAFEQEVIIVYESFVVVWYRYMEETDRSGIGFEKRSLRLVSRLGGRRGIDGNNSFVK